MVTADFKELEWVEETFRSFKHPWFICGGWALDLFLGYETREHSDIEVGVFREHQNALQLHLRGWWLNWLENGNKNEWETAVYLNSPVHEILAESATYKLEILLNEKDNSTWIYRRNNKIQLPVINLIRWRDNLPFLCPEAVLLYKSRNIRPKDRQDFDIVFPHLKEEQKKWLKESLELANENPSFL